MEAVNYDIREITANIKEWCGEVYPTRTLDQVIDKLREEMQEWTDRPLDGWELADMMIVLFDLADILGFDIAKLVHHKMNVNRKRQWLINAEGLLKHVKPTGPDAGRLGEALAHDQHQPSADSGRTPVQRGIVGGGIRQTSGMDRGEDRDSSAVQPEA